MKPRDAMLLIKFFTHRKNLTPAQKSRFDRLLARDCMAESTSSEADVFRLLDIWEQQGLDAAVKEWKSLPEQYFKESNPKSGKRKKKSSRPTHPAPATDTGEKQTVKHMSGLTPEDVGITEEDLKAIIEEGTPPADAPIIFTEYLD